MNREYNGKISLLDLFAGCGGLSQGFRDAGFHVTAAVEWWAPAAETYRRNHPDTQLFVGDITQIKETLFTTYAPSDFTGLKWAGRKIPLERVGTADDVANLMFFLASEDSNYMTGQSIGVDGGCSAV